MASSDGTLTNADALAADAALAGLAESLPDSIGHLKHTAYLSARAYLATVMAEVRTAGYLEGVQRGRQEAAYVVLDALRGEGLAPMHASTPGDGW